MGSFSDRKFYRDTPLNRITASSALGNGATDEEIRQAELRVGTISFSTGNDALTIVAPATDFGAAGSISVGDVISYIDPSTSQPALVGVVDTVTVASGVITAIDLRANAANTATGVQWTVGGVFINSNESFWISIATNLVQSGSQVQIPNLESLRTPISQGNSGNPNNPVYIALTQFSDNGNVNTDSVGGGTNITGLLLPGTVFRLVPNNANRWFNTNNDFPVRCWMAFNPFGPTGQNLVDGTLYNLSCVQVLPSVDLPTQYPFSPNGNFGWL